MAILRDDFGVALRARALALVSSRRRMAGCCAALLLAFSVPVVAQQTTPTDTTQAPAATQPAAAPPAAQPAATAPAAAQQPAAPDASQQPAQAPATAPDAAAPTAEAPQTTPAASKNEKKESAESPGITEEEIKQLLVGKELYLRGGYLDNTLEFGEHGQLVSHSPQGSYTLSGIEIEKVHLTKHKLELEGARYGLHFLGALPYEDPTKAVNRVRITPKKKVVRITIDRELIVTPKKAKEAKVKGKKTGAPVATSNVTGTGPAAATDATAASAAAPAPGADTAAANPPAATATDAAPAAPPAATPAPASSDAAAATSQPAAGAAEPGDAEQEKAEMAAAPEAERPADPGSITTTISPAHAAGVLKDALDKIFAPGLDDRLMASLPDFWKLYYQAAAAKTDYRPKDPSILRQGTVDQKATIIGKFEPDSNEFAQASGIAGPALYHAVIGIDGKATEIAVARPIGFGLDESAVDAIRKASFQPAIKDGKPVPVLLDLYVPFRIYSKRTAIAGKPDDKPSGPQLPGPYTLQEQEQQQQSK